MMDSSIRRLYDNLRNVTVAVVYPPGEDRDIVTGQLKRIGCKLQAVWPFPAVPPPGVDVIFFQVAQDLKNRDEWNATAVDATLIALSDYENPTILKLLLDTHAYGVITKPFRSSGILSTLVLALSCKNFQDRQQNKIRKLEDTIKSRRHIEKALRILMDHERMSESQAYDHMRTRATSLRVTVAEISTMVIDAREAMDKVGLGGKNRRT